MEMIYGLAAKHQSEVVGSKLLQSQCVPEAPQSSRRRRTCDQKKPLPKPAVTLGKLGHCFTAVYTSSGVFKLYFKGYTACQNT